MSYDIEYNRKVFVQENPEEKYETDRKKYLVIGLQGCNNVTDLRGRRERSWRYIASGKDYECFEKIVKLSANCESGGLQLKNGGTKAENFIKLYRKEFKNAQPIKDFFSGYNYWDIKSHIEISKEKINGIENQYERERLQDFINKYKPQDKDKYLLFEFDIKDMTGFEDYDSIVYYADSWRWVSIRSHDSI